MIIKKEYVKSIFRFVLLEFSIFKLIIKSVDMSNCLPLNRNADD